MFFFSSTSSNNLRRHLLLLSNKTKYQGFGGVSGGSTLTSRLLSSTIQKPATTPIVSRIQDRRVNETGPGGRGSDAGLKVAVFGASGFLGRYVCCHLGTNGYMTYIGNRGDDLEMRFLKPMFELGRSKIDFYSPRDRESIRDVIADADMVINMVGKSHETYHVADSPTFPYLKFETNTSFEEANITFPQTLAEICMENQVDHMIHVSSINASPTSNSRWARTKYEGEMAVRDTYPYATILRPSQLFGVEDNLLNWFATIANRLPFVPMFMNEGNALTQPVYAVNVADVIQKIVDDPEKFEGRTVDCFGPSDYTYRELAEFVYDITQQNPSMVNVPNETFGKVVNLAGPPAIFGKPMVTEDMVHLWNEDFIPTKTQEEYDAEPSMTKNFTMKDFGIDPVPIEKIAFNYLHRFRDGGHFAIEKGYH